MRIISISLFFLVIFSFAVFASEPLGEISDVDGNSAYVIRSDDMSTLKAVYKDKIVKTVDYKTIDYTTGEMISEDAYYYIEYASDSKKEKAVSGMKLYKGDVVVGEGTDVEIDIYDYSDIKVSKGNIRTIIGKKAADKKVSEGLIEKDDERLKQLKKELQKIALSLDEKGVYAINPFEDRDPTQVLDLASKLFNRARWLLWDVSFSKLFNSRSEGYTCQDFVDNTEDRVVKAVKDIYKDKALLETVYFMEKSSTYHAEGILDAMDDILLFRDNHVSYRLTIDGERYYIDFWKHSVTGAEVIDVWENGEKSWKDLLGDEFCSQQKNVLIGPEEADDGKVYCDS
ncbi:hypothetical protein GF336_03590 [Candidatus Woesearchaeota archaeon]|nr:hypothetical protein [Candidatus Woesearchaeota archaeon]